MLMLNLYLELRTDKTKSEIHVEKQHFQVY